MTRPWRIAAAILVGFIACRDSAGPSAGAGGIALQILPSSSGGAALDSGRVSVSGPTNVTVKATPGSPVTINALAAGTYTVTLEGFVGLYLANYVQIQNVTVNVGQVTNVTVPSFPLARLVFLTPPSSVGLGRAMSPGVKVSLVDGNGTAIPTATNSVTLAIGTNPSGAAFTTTQTVAAVNGVATFSNLAITETGAGYTIVASSGPLATTTSAAFNVTNKAIVTHYVTSGTVDIIETATNTVTGSVAVGNSPYDEVAFTANGAFAYVPNNGSASVSVIDVAAGTAVATVTVGSSPYGLAFGVTGSGPRVFVPNYGSNNVSVINTTNNTVVATIPGFASPIRAAVTPDGSKALVTNFGGPSVSVIATASNSITGSVAVGAGPQGIAINSAGTFAYVANSQASTVSVINLSSSTVVATITVGSFPVGIAVTPDGQFVYVANQIASTVSVIATSSNSVVATIPVTGGSRNLTISPGGRYVYVPGYSSPNVWVVSTATNAVVNQVVLSSASAVGIGIAPKP